MYLDNKKAGGKLDITADVMRMLNAPKAFNFDVFAGTSHLKPKQTVNRFSAHKSTIRLSVFVR